MRVCILGNSLSGLTLAKALVNQNVYVDIFMPEKTLKINKTRTIGISKSNIKFFNKNIINLEKIIWKLNRIEIFSDNDKNEKVLNFEDNKEYLFSIVRYYELFDDSGKIKKHKKINPINLEGQLKTLRNDLTVEEVESVCHFLRKIWNYNTKTRITIKEALRDEFLN